MIKHSRSLKRFAFAAAALLLAVPAVHAVPMIFVTTLTGPGENPPVPSPGTGSAIVTLDTAVHTLRVQVGFEDLLSPTVAAHIHCCVDPPGTVGVATRVPTFLDFPLGVTSGVYDRIFDTLAPSTYNPAFVTANGGTAEAEAALAAGLTAGRAYLNIHSDMFRSGEIRGFLTVPEPQSYALLGIGLLGIAFAGRRRKTT